MTRVVHKLHSPHNLHDLHSPYSLDDLHSPHSLPRGASLAARRAARGPRFEYDRQTMRAPGWAGAPGAPGALRMDTFPTANASPGTLSGTLSGTGVAMMDASPLSLCGDGLQNLTSPGGSAYSIDKNSDLGDMYFNMTNYVGDTLKMMCMMRSHHMLTDVVLQAGSEQFHAHKLVLASASPYFKAMFTGGLKECDMSHVKLQGVCPTTLARILTFMYTGVIRVTEVTVCQLLPAATMFQVPDVISACCVFLERQLDPSNVIGIANFAEQHGCKELHEKANQFIEQHFSQICQEEEFFQLSAMQLVALVKKDALNVQDEQEVYNAVLQWVKYDEENRRPKMEHILQAVRCQFLTPAFLSKQMKSCDLLKKLPQCRKYLAQIFKDMTLHKKPVVKERTPNTPRVIYIAGGYLRYSLDILEAFNADDRTWTPLAKLTVPRSGLGGAFLKGMFYAVGGRNNAPGSSYDSDWVDRYHPVLDQWRPCSPMTTPRNRVGVAVMDGYLYAVGGSSGSDYHDSVERYDPDEDRWTLICPMAKKRLGVGVAVVNRMLYAMGGYDGSLRLNSAECYHPENNEWTPISSMRVARSGAGVATLNNHVYIVGGYDGSKQLSSVERYDTETDTWEFRAPIRIARSALSVTVLDGKLYAMGGYDGSSFLSIVEVYDPLRDVWDEGEPLTSGRSGHASAVSYHLCVIHCDQHEHALSTDSSLGGCSTRPSHTLSALTGSSLNGVHGVNGASNMNSANGFTTEPRTNGVGASSNPFLTPGRGLPDGSGPSPPFGP